MKKILVLLLTLGFFSCSDSDSGSSSGSPAPANPVVRGQGRDVGSSIAAHFTETQIQPQAEACDANNTKYRFDSRLQPNMSWQMITETNRPDFISTETTASTLASAEQGVLTINNRMNYSVQGAENYDLQYDTISSINSNQPQTEMKPINNTSAADLARVQELMKSRCTFTPAGTQATQQKDRYGSFMLTGGALIPGAIHSVVKLQGQWACRDENGAITQQAQNVTQTTETILTYDVPMSAAVNSCRAVPIYTYITVTDANNQVLESQRKELAQYKM